MKNPRIWFQKNPNAFGDHGPGTTDTEGAMKPGQAPESKKKEHPFYNYGKHSGTFLRTGSQPSSSGQNGQTKSKVHFLVDGDAAHQDVSISADSTAAPSKGNVKGTSGAPSAGCFGGVFPNGDESPDSTFEIPLDDVYSSASKNNEKPKNEDSATSTRSSRPEILTRSRSHRSNSTESSILKASSKLTATLSDKSSNSQSKRHTSYSETGKGRLASSMTNINSSSDNTAAGSRKYEALYRKSANPGATTTTTTTKHANRFPKVPITGVASATYCGGWLPPDGMKPYPKDVAKLNKFLKNCRSEVEAGVPGRWLTVVIGNEAGDLDSIVSTLAYAFFLGSTGNEDQQFFVPVLNMRREDFVLHTEAVWLFECSGVDLESVMFVDQISLSYFHRFGSLKLILVDHSRLAPHQENLQEAVIEIVDHSVPENLYPWVSTLEIEQVGSCSTIIAERYVAEAPQLAAGRGLSRLLLAAILLDTNNLESTQSRCTSRDECMAAFLLHGAGRYGRHGFYRLLRKNKYDVSGLSTKDTMRKDFKQWTLGPGKTDVCGCKGRNVAAGMSTLGMALYEFLRRDSHILNDIQLFRRSKKLDVLIIITGYYDNANHYKREFLVAPEDEELTRHLTTCFKAHSEELKLSPLHIDGLPKDMLAYIQGNVTASRRTIRSIVAEFFAS